MFSLEGCRPETDVFHWEVSAFMNCWLYKSACLKTVSAWGGPLMHWKVPTLPIRYGGLSLRFDSPVAWSLHQHEINVLLFGWFISTTVAPITSRAHQAYSVITGVTGLRTLMPALGILFRDWGIHLGSDMRICGWITAGRYHTLFVATSTCYEHIFHQYPALYVPV